MARIELEQVTKRYPGGVPAVNNLTLDIPDGDFMALVGPLRLGQDDRAADGGRAGAGHLR
jgi:multiple sugar transport system ATP-binding protein